MQTYANAPDSIRGLFLVLPLHFLSHTLWAGNQCLQGTGPTPPHPASPCGTYCKDHGYAPDECGCGVCGSFGGCSFSCNAAKTSLYVCTSARQRAACSPQTPPQTCHPSHPRPALPLTADHTVVNTTQFLWRRVRMHCDPMHSSCPLDLCFKCPPQHTCPSPSPNPNPQHTCPSPSPGPNTLSRTRNRSSIRHHSGTTHCTSAPPPRL